MLPYTASTVFAQSAALLNDTVQAVFTDEVQAPYLNLALQELQEEFELNNVAVTNSTSAVITVPAETTQITREPTVADALPHYPNDLVEIQQLWEQNSGETRNYIPMTRKEFLPYYLQPTNNLIFFTWKEQIIEFIGATADITVKIDYVKALFVPITLGTQTISIINSQTFLSFRTAALCAKYIMENESRSDELNQEAKLAIDRVEGLASKGRQSIQVRRRPFMASYKGRGIY